METHDKLVYTLDQRLRDDAMNIFKRDLEDRLAEIYKILRCQSSDTTQITARDENLRLLTTTGPLYMTISDLLENAKNAILTHSRAAIGNEAVAKFLADHEARRERD